MGDHRVYHLARVVVPETDVSIFVGGDGERQRRMADQLVDLSGGGVRALLRRFETHNRLGGLRVEDDAVRTRERGNHAVRVVAGEVDTRRYAVLLRSECVEVLHLKTQRSKIL